MMGPIQLGFRVGNKLMYPGQLTLTRFPIAGHHLIVDIYPRQVSEAPPAIGIDHGARSHAGVHQLLGLRPTDALEETLLLSPDRICSIEGKSTVIINGVPLAFARFSSWCQIGRIFSSVFSILNADSACVSWI